MTDGADWVDLLYGGWKPRVPQPWEAEPGPGKLNPAARSGVRQLSDYGGQLAPLLP
jgi:hypothetical protein